MKNAYTLVELIFVIVIIGVLAGVASTSFKSDYLRADMSYIAAKIKEAQYKGIGFEHKAFGTDIAAADYNNGCIDLEKTALESHAVDGNIKYVLHVDSFDAGTICFDAKGRPHTDDFSPGTLLSVKTVVNLAYDGQAKQITILPLSGFAIIGCN